MLSETPKKTRLVITYVMVIAALITIFAEPLIVKQVLPPIIEGQQARYEKKSASDDPQDKFLAEIIKDTPYLVGFFYPLWMGLGVVASIVVLVIARAYYRGEQWARAVALFCFAMPAMGGAYMLVPSVNFTGFSSGTINTIIISMLGLIPYFTILLAEKSDLMQKVVNFFVFAILGVQGAHSFANGHASMRIQWMHPARPVWAEGTWVLWIGTQVMWWGTIATILAIFYLAMRKKTGWYLALIGGLITMFSNYWVHLVRGTTSDYILGGTFGLIIVVLMLIPAFKQRLFDEPEVAA
ncbi:MAG: hypothetical protein U9Q82_12280 [Chloroflexota bacterium]|nr:hypothetical protein [Chloroflexota bacterium]